MRTCLFLLALTLCLTAELRADALDSALTAIGRTRADFRVDTEVLSARTGHRFKLPVFDQWFSHPLRIPFYERHLRNAMLDSRGRLHSLWGSTAGIVGAGTRRDLIPPTPLRRYAEQAAKPGALVDAIRALDPAAIVPSPARVPDSVQQAAAMILFAAKDALDWRDLALRDIPADRVESLYQSLTEPFERSVNDTIGTTAQTFPQTNRTFYEQTDLLERLDLRMLGAGADDLTAVLDSAVALLSSLGEPEAFSFACATRYGRVSISAGANDRHPDTHALLSLDLSGDDWYPSGGATGGPDQPLGILIDLRGLDHYDARSSAPAFGTGILGYGFLYDAQGSDHYILPGFYSQGCGLGGVGLLWDGDGDDAYTVTGGGQGFGYFGIGILADTTGSDLYDAFVMSQGCGMTRGVGLLADFSGNDSYTANDEEILYPSPQSNEHNASMCQGAGYGVRRDYVDGHSLAGGVGILLDGAGDDRYFGGVFSQAVGYWYAIGILDDRAGNDTYRDVWYGQSATAHMGLSYLTDGSGDDTYTSLMTMSAGAAHDFSASLFVEEGGNDTYTQAANCLGRSLNSSAALFVDLRGDDAYQGSEAFGTSRNDSQTGLRAEVSSDAIFLDLGGTDTYSDTTAANNTLWRQTSATPIPVLRGVGFDTERQPLKWE